MEQIAFILRQTIVYWSSIVLTLAVGTGICLFWAFYLGKKGSGISAAVVVPLAVLLSVVLARLVHWYCRQDVYRDFYTAMTDYAEGSYALAGMFAGCFLAALIVWLLKIDRNLPRMLDCMSLAGCAAICLGRLACFFSPADRGQVVNELLGFPWAYPVTNPVSGIPEYRLATFLLQAGAAGAIFLILVSLMFSDRTLKAMSDGDVTLLFLLFYCPSQIVLDSTRYDSLYLPGNGFVSLVQILCALGLLTVVVTTAIRAVRANGLKFWYLPVCIAIAGLMGFAGYMEYYVQRRGNQAVFAYGNMSACLAGTVLLTLVLWFYAVRRERILRMPTIY